MGVFICGELCLNDELDTISRIQNVFFSKEQGHLLEAQVRKAHKDWIALPEHLLNQNDYRELLSKIEHELKRFDDHLEQQLDQQRANYVRSVVELRIKQLWESFPDKPHSNSQAMLADYWRNVGERLADMVADFAIEYVVVFGMKKLRPEEPMKLEVVASHGALPELNTDDVILDLSELPDEQRRQPTNSLDCPRLLDAIKGFSSKPSVQNTLLRLLPAPLLPEANVALMIGYTENNPLDSIDNKRGGHLDRALELFYAVVLSAYSSTIAAAERDLTERNLRVFSHEGGHLAFGLDGLRRTYLASEEDFRNLAAAKAGDIAGNLAAFVDQIRLLFNRARMMIAIPAPRKEEFLIFGELLCKCQDMFRNETNARRMIMDVHCPAT
ncbi:MAG: hypothetical protein NT018_08775, partial [Armatimonadetes bacterium]|nr:hypothetical protein [Armatimonadota bacterium]